MVYESVDQLQKALTTEVFQYAKDSKKAAGRALGTIVEIITFYLLKSWGLNNSISIERKIPEFGNLEITHNVEYSLHPIIKEYHVEIQNNNKSITSHRLLKILKEKYKNDNFDSFIKQNNTLVSKDRILRNACTIGTSDRSYLVASIDNETKKKRKISIALQSTNPFAIFECKRVGVEEGTKKGPQTIEKAKQGAYVANVVSSLQKVRLENGELYGVIFKDKKLLYSKPYYEILDEIIKSEDPYLLRSFILTVGIVSNHGNWFTSEDHNKELKVLAQSYDWLIFLTDQGITEFIDEVILHPLKKYEKIKFAFLASYNSEKTKNQFTKVQMNLDANNALLNYFNDNISKIENWFNIISPTDVNLDKLKEEISLLKNKDWSKILE